MHKLQNLMAQVPTLQTIQTQVSTGHADMARAGREHMISTHGATPAIIANMKKHITKHHPKCKGKARDEAHCEEILTGGSSS